MFQSRNLLKLVMVMTLAYSTMNFMGCASAPPESTGPISSQVKANLFDDAKKAWQEAIAINADVLAPENYDQGVEFIKKAQADMVKEQNMKDIRANLSKAEAAFRRAIHFAKMAGVAYPNSIKARQDAVRSESAKYSPEKWKEAESKFSQATRYLEGDNIVESKNKAREADVLFREAELDAIKVRYLSETKKLLKKADELGVKDNAPKTLAQAASLMKQAEKELNENRYDIDVARSLAYRSKHDVNHAIFLAAVIKKAKENKQTWEGLLLATEMPIQRIAEQTGRLASFEAGVDVPTDRIIVYIAALQDSVRRVSQELNWYVEESRLQQARIAELVQMLGSKAQEKSEMTKLLGRQNQQKLSLRNQLAAQARVRELYTTVESSFDQNEARVLRENDDIIIRLVGLEFPSNEATIEKKSFELLTKVRDAINTFQGCTITVTGYTDSWGSDVQNLTLSTERAEAVRQYILANTELPETSVEAIGYGESQPISSNETELGRSNNRRVEVVIHPW
ncbi:MAG: OmpA family protein [Candidatus Marinimicrobia bacterium]|nr:OmpA family protein [Candidatus Neomarinimicrobiota bacterium]